jgi:hypothetical protein
VATITSGVLFLPNTRRRRVATIASGVLFLPNTRRRRVATIASGVLFLCISSGGKTIESIIPNATVAPVELLRLQESADSQFVSSLQAVEI